MFHLSYFFYSFSVRNRLTIGWIFHSFRLPGPQKKTSVRLTRLVTWSGIFRMFPVVLDANLLARTIVYQHGCGASPLTLGRSRSLTSSIGLPREHKENGHVTDFFGICETGSLPTSCWFFSFELHGDAYKKWTTKWCLPSAIKGAESFAAQMYDGLILCSCLLVCLRCWKILLKADIHQKTQHYVNICKISL